MVKRLTGFLFSGYRVGTLQKRTKRKKKKVSQENKRALRKLKGYRKEETALITRRRKIKKIMSDKANVMPKPKRLRIHKL